MRSMRTTLATVYHEELPLGDAASSPNAAAFGLHLTAGPFRLAPAPFAARLLWWRNCHETTRLHRGDLARRSRRRRFDRQNLPSFQGGDGPGAGEAAGGDRRA